MPKKGEVMSVTGFKSDAFAGEKPKKKEKRPEAHRMFTNEEELQRLRQKILRPIPHDKRTRIEKRIARLETILSGYRARMSEEAEAAKITASLMMPPVAQKAMLEA